MRIVRDRAKFSIYILSFLAVASRVGFIASSWILLVSRFEINPILAGIMSILVQGFTIAMKPISEKCFNYVSVQTSLVLGGALGAICSVVLIRVNSIIPFLAVVLIASQSKVFLESTFPKITHSYVAKEENFSSKLTGVQQGAVLFVSALIAPIALSSIVLGPIYITAFLYASVLFFVLKYKFRHSKVDSIHQVINARESDIKRRLDDIVLNDSIRKNQSRIHKFRRVPATLLSMDLSINIISGSAMMLMPLCFIEMSKVSQGMDSTLCMIYGVFAILSGFILNPFLQSKVKLNDEKRWKLLLVTMSLAVLSTVFYTTFAGVTLAVVSAAVFGICLVMFHSNLYKIAANNLTDVQYQAFGTTIMQRNAIARVVSPVAIGVFTAMTSLEASLALVFVLSCIFVAVISCRVILILRGIRSAEKLLAEAGKLERRIEEPFTIRYSRGSLYQENTRTNQQAVYQVARSKQERSSYNRFRLYRLKIWFAIALPQKIPDVAPARGAPRSK